jgi:hypothetical protein
MKNNGETTSGVILVLLFNKLRSHRRQKKFFHPEVGQPTEEQAWAFAP